MDVSSGSAVVRSLLSIEANDDLSSAVVLIDALVVSGLEPQFVVKCLARLVLRFHSLLVSKRVSIQKFFEFKVISRQNPIQALLYASLALCASVTTCGQLRHNYVIESLQSIDQSLTVMASDVSSALTNIRFRTLVLANLLALRSAASFVLPVHALVKRGLQLCCAPALDPLVAREAAPTLREAGFRLLEALVVTLENDIVVFVSQINRTIVDCIETPQIEGFLLKYLRIASFHWTDDHLSRVVVALRARIHSTEKRRAHNAFECLRALLVHGFDARDVSRDCSQLLLQYYRSRAPNTWDDALRMVTWRLLLDIDDRHPTTVSLLTVAVARDDNHDVRHFCLRALNRFEGQYREDEDIEANPVSESEEQSVAEPQSPVTEPMQVEEAECVVSVDLSEAELMLKEFCCE